MRVLTVVVFVTIMVSPHYCCVLNQVDYQNHRGYFIFKISIGPSLGVLIMPLKRGGLAKARQCSIEVWDPGILPTTYEDMV